MSHTEAADPPAEVRSYGSGVDADFEAFYRSERQGLVGLARATVGDHATAEEIVHDVLAKVYLRWARIEEPLRYARRAVANASRNELRRRSVRRRHLEVTVTSTLDADELFDALAKLRPRERAAIALRYYSDLSYADIAEALECRESTARNLVHRALEHLEAALG
ncbi:MAG: sigma-70 family RNA polymerase sigma factor [Acidimicrobiia bacterium]|nr:sigma-70 family RNA polymerase sigma factor [Acidimicrobiia bacterium]